MQFKLNDGTTIPALAWGNGTGDAKKTAIESGKIVLKTGIKHIDTAQGYDNESETGESIRASGVDRADVYVTSKLSQEGGAADKDPIKVEDVRESVRGTIERLGFQPNLLLVHNPFVAPPGQLLTFWKVLEEMKESGELTSTLGVSNFRPQDLELLLKEAKIVPAVNQLEYHPFVLTHLDPILEICLRANILIESYGPLSPLLRHPSKGGPLRPILARIAKRLSDQTGKDVDEAQVLLLWTWAKGVVTVTASGNEGRIKRLAETVDLPGLEESEVREIEEVGRKIHFRAYDEHLSVDFPAPALPQDL